MPSFNYRLALLAGCLLVALALLATPAAACGCGAYVPREGDAHVAQERALLRWDGSNEDIVMALSVEGRSQEAAWILPVPSRATVKLADPKLFEALQTLTRPLERVEYIRGDGAMAGGAPGAAVTLLERQALGPFDVATLAASDSTALGGWLSDNGFQFPPGLQDVLEPYVDQGWEYVAVRLTPEAAGELSGELDPLWVSFASDTLVYPMRPTSLARNPLPVFLYVLAEHRVAQPPAFEASDNARPGWSEVSYAQWVEPDSLEPDSPLAPFVDRRLFLTKFDIFLQNPEAIDDDFVFAFAPADELFHKVEVRYETVDGPLPAEPGTRFALVAALVVLAAAAVGVLLLVRRRRAGT